MGLIRIDRLNFIYTNPKNPDEVWLKVTDKGLNYTQIGEIAYEMDVWFIKWQYSVTKIYSTNELHRKAFRYGEKIFSAPDLSKYRVMKTLERWISNNGHSKHCKCPLCSAERQRIADEEAGVKRLEVIKTQQEIERSKTPEDFARELIPPIQAEVRVIDKLSFNRTEEVVMLSKDYSLFKIDWSNLEPMEYR